MSTHTLVPAPDSAQVWRDSGEALPDELMRVDIVDCEGLTFRSLASWDGQGFTICCPVCGAWPEVAL